MRRKLLLVHDSFAYRGGGEQMLLRVARTAASHFDLELALLWARDPGVLTPEEQSQFGKLHLQQFPNRIGISSWFEQRRCLAQLRKTALQGKFAGIISFSLRPALRVAQAIGNRLPNAWMCQQSFPLFEPPLRGLKETLGYGAFRRAKTRIVTIADAASKEVRRAALGEPTLIRNGIDVSRFADTVHTRQGPANTGDLTIVCVARIDPIKNHRVLLRALRIARDKGRTMRLLCVGGPVPHAASLPDELRALADELGIAGQIEWVGEVPDPRPWLGRADVAVLPSHKEAMGLVLAEAGAAGLPLVGSRVGGIPEVVRDGTSGITFAPDDPEQLAQALLSLQENPALRAKLADGAQRMAEEDFNAQRQDDLWSRFLSGLCKQP
jgi:glycosyltransferase involved in cell wall biosynthesis